MPTVPKIRALPAAVERYLSNLGRLMQTDVARARELLRRVLPTPITMHPQGSALMAIVQGDLAGILGVVGNFGAGGPSWRSLTAKETFLPNPCQFWSRLSDSNR